MPLFDWLDALAWLEFRPGPIRILRNEMVRWEQELEEAGVDAPLIDEEERAKLARSRWLEEHSAERSFACGLVPDPHEVQTGAPRLNVLPAEVPRPMAVTAAVLPDDVAFIRDGHDGVEEVGRIRRTAIVGVDVVDRSGVHVPEPVRETIEPTELALLVLTWTNEGVDDEDRFAFRSAWMAWTAGRRLMEARRS